MGGETAGSMSTHVGDLILVAADANREMVGRVIDIRLGPLKRRSPPVALVSEGKESLHIYQKSWIATKTCRDYTLVDGSTLDWVRRKIG